jgi:general secretion pathway protein B
MSFILDALKKAESERNRAAGPVLMNVRIAPPRRRLPAWAWILGCVLVANLAVLAWLLLRTPQASTAAAALAGPVTTAPAPAMAAPASSPAAAAPVGAAPPASTVYATPPPTLPSTSVAAPTTSITSARPAPPPPPADLATLPSLQEVVAAGVNLPALVMNMHVYDPAPTQRYVLLNGLRLAEGEFTPDGIKVESITERGAVLDARGHRFLLPAGGD